MNSIGDASIDDIFFTPGPCQESAALGQSCTFIDFTQCGFTQNTTISSLTWKTYSGGNQLLRSAPVPYDHTTGTSRGSYVYIDLDNQGENLNGRLYSPPYSLTMNQSYCVEFYYILLGGNNTFNVYTESATGTRRTIFTRNYDHGLLWNKGGTTITGSDQSRIFFEIVTGYLRQGNESKD